jgi:hypothetical protein
VDPDVLLKKRTVGGSASPGCLPAVSNLVSFAGVSAPSGTYSFHRDVQVTDGDGHGWTHRRRLGKRAGEPMPTRMAKVGTTRGNPPVSTSAVSKPSPGSPGFRCAGCGSAGPAGPLRVGGSELVMTGPPQRRATIWTVRPLAGSAPPSSAARVPAGPPQIPHRSGIETAAERLLQRPAGHSRHVGDLVQRNRMVGVGLDVLGCPANCDRRCPSRDRADRTPPWRCWGRCAVR